jgi:hypothetical protein
MPVTRCQVCWRGFAGYLDGEKKLTELDRDEILTEILKYEAKETWIREYIDRLRDGMVAPQIYPDGMPCPGCEHGRREFQRHRKDLEQLRLSEARSALNANTKNLNRLRRQREIAPNADF